MTMQDADDQLRAWLSEASEMLPDEADLDDYAVALSADDFSAALMALRQAASEFPTPLGFWMLLSRVEDHLGGE